MINYMKGLYLSKKENIMRAWIKSHSKRPYSNIETLRGITIILIVIGHVVGSASNGGMKVSDDSFLRYIYCLFDNIRLPLLTAISGWVYALHPVKVEDFIVFIGKKVRRLLIPMIFVGTLYFLVQYLVPGTNEKGDLTEIWRIYLFPYTLYWYLPSLFIIFVSIATLDAFKVIEKFKGWLFILFIAIALAFIEKDVLPQTMPNFFSFRGAMFLSSFFVLGLGIRRFSDKLYSSASMRRLWLYGIICGVIIQQLQWFWFGEDSASVALALNLIIGMVSTLFLLNTTYTNKFFMWIGSYAYTIYLFHAFGTAGGRIILSLFNVNSAFVVFFMSLFLGILLPIIADVILSKNRITEMLFLGEKRAESKK